MSGADVRLLPFKVGASLVVLIAAFVAFVVPESLSLEARDRLVKMAATEQTQEAGPTASGASTSYRRRFGRLVQRVWSRALKHILAPLDALSVFKPRPFPDGRPGRDWNLFNIAVINFLITLSRVSIDSWYKLTSRRNHRKYSMSSLPLAGGRWNWGDACRCWPPGGR